MKKEFVKIHPPVSIIKRLLLFSAIILCACTSRADDIESLKTYRVGYHIHSKFSYKGKYSLEELSCKAKEKGIDAIITADHALRQWEWGVQPLENVIKKVVVQPSVFMVGVNKYLEETERINNETAGALIIPGLEITPHYFWDGTPLKGLLELYNSHKHFVVFGLRHIKMWERLPIIHNLNGYEFKTKDVVKLWPVILIILSLISLFQKGLRHKITSSIALIIGIIFFINEMPFKYFKYNQYNPNIGDMPYQEVIDYVNGYAGLIYWAHPETNNYEDKKVSEKITIKTPLYRESLLKTQNYNGFGYFFDCKTLIGQTGGIWDKVLLEYCTGKRQKPVFAAGELDLVDAGKDFDYIKHIVNVVYADELSGDSLQSSMRKGMYYIQYNKGSELVLSDFIFKTNKQRAIFGQTLQSAAADEIIMKFKIQNSNTKIKSCNVVIIENGTTIFNQKQSLPYYCVFKGKAPEPSKTDYYRLEITADDGSKIITNPIFVE